MEERAGLLRALVFALSSTACRPPGFGASSLLWARAGFTAGRAPWPDGCVLAAWYLLTAFRKLAQGEIRHQENEVGVLPDLQRSELMMIVPLVVMFFVIGLYPNLLLDHIVPAVEILLP